MKTMICMILDRSGSMAGRESDVIGGVNSFLEEQKKLPDPATIALVRFDSEAVERFRQMGNLADIKPLEKEEYLPRASTPLLDVVGKTINELDEDWKREQPDRCIVVIVTDGAENCSREYTKAKIKEMIQVRQDSKKWAFIYLGTEVDAFAEAGGIGVAHGNTAGYVKSAAGMRSMFGATGQAVATMRGTGQTVAENLGGNIDEQGKVNKTTSFQPSPAWQAPKQTSTWTEPK